MTDEILRAGLEASQLVTYSLVAAAGAAVGATLAFLQTRAGDEPPIRVRGGSVGLDLIHNRHRFRIRNNKKEWKLSNGNRERNRFLIYIGPKPGHLDKLLNGVVHVGGAVTFIHDDGQVVKFTSLNLQTQIDSVHDMDYKAGSHDRTIEYAPQGFIKEITVDGTVVARFTAAGQLDSVLVTEEP